MTIIVKEKAIYNILIILKKADNYMHTIYATHIVHAMYTQTVKATDTHKISMIGLQAGN